MLTHADLNQFTGTEQWYQHPFNKKITFTDGVHYVAEEGKAFWLLDAIVSHQTNKKVRKEEFQVWKLTVNQEDNSGLLVCQDGDYNEIIRQEIEFTDFPLSEIIIWLTDNVLLLPSKY